MVWQFLINQIKKQKILQEHKQEMNRQFGLLELEAISTEAGEEAALSLFEFLKQGPTGYLNISSTCVKVRDGRITKQERITDEKEQETNILLRLSELEAICLEIGEESALRVFELMQQGLTGQFAIYSTSIWITDGRIDEII